MPRGNDADAALHELADKFGRGVGNAEELIEATMAHRSEALRRAELLPRDPEATAEARKNISKLKGPNGEEVVDVAVRGGTKVIVYRDDRDALHIHALDERDKAIEDESSLEQAPSRDLKPGGQLKPKADVSPGQPVQPK